jgi:hypothetical protein
LNLMLCYIHFASEVYFNFPYCHIKTINIKVGFWFMVLNDTFNNISVIAWRSALLVEEIGVSGENHRPPASH